MSETLFVEKCQIVEYDLSRLYFMGEKRMAKNKIKRSITNFNSEITQNNTKTKITFQKQCKKEETNS